MSKQFVIMFLKLVSVSGGIKEYGRNVESSHTLIKKKNET